MGNRNDFSRTANMMVLLPLVTGTVDAIGNFDDGEGADVVFCLAMAQLRDTYMDL